MRTLKIWRRTFPARVATRHRRLNRPCDDNIEVRLPECGSSKPETGIHAVAESRASMDGFASGLLRRGGETVDMLRQAVIAAGGQWQRDQLPLSMT
jgi:hypothetical protein